MDCTTALTAFTRRLERRSSLSSEDRRALSDLSGVVRTLPANSVIGLAQGEHPGAALILAGLAAAVEDQSNGARQITAFYLPGEFCGLSTLIAGVPFPSRVLTSSTVFFPSNDEFTSVVKDHPTIGEALVRDIIGDALSASKLLSAVGRKNAEQRIAHLLCEMGVRAETRGQSRFSFSMRMTQDNVADALGLTAVHVNRTIRSLTEQGVIAIHRSLFEIRDWKRLATLARFDANYLGTRAIDGEEEKAFQPKDHRNRQAAAINLLPKELSM